MIGQVKRRHHTVPKVLLLGFVDSKNRLVMRRRDGSNLLTSLNDASVRGDFYSYRDSDGVLVDEVETWLGDGIESPVAEVLVRARRGEQLASNDVVHLARLAASGLLRTPTIRSYLDQLDAHLGPLLLMHRHLTAAAVDPTALSPEAMKRVHATAATVWNDCDKLSANEQSKLRTFLREFDKLSQRLSTWSWNVLTAKHPCLITADAPVVTLGTDDGGWHGVLPKGSPVFIPVSSRHLLIGEQHPIGRGSFTIELAKMVNIRMTSEAYDAVFADPIMPWPDHIVLEPRRPTLPHPTVSWSRSQPGSEPTFPTAYPAVEDDRVRALLDSLGAVDTVE